MTHGRSERADAELLWCAAMLLLLLVVMGREGRR
jgi:hypothetical protein